MEAPGPNPRPEGAEPLVRWRALHDEAKARLAAVGNEFAPIDARRIVEEASGAEPGEFVAMLDEFAKQRHVAHFDHMLTRRLSGEPLQYVLGRWAFRTLDLAVDARVLIPRPETEGVVDLALSAIADIDDREIWVADLGTGSGCIGLAIVAEDPRVQMICTDSSEKAIAAARQNAAGLGRPSRRVEIRHGDWFRALPQERLGQFDVIISNPPYVAEDEVLAPVVADWEPRSALIAGPTGLEDAEVLIAGAREWLRPGGTLVLELGETQLQRAASLAEAAGFVDIEIHRDLAERDRALVAHKSVSSL